jgi:hypothetical protein
MGMEMPLGAVNRSLGADAPRDLVCTGRLSVAREKEEVRQVASSCCRNGWSRRCMTKILSNSLFTNWPVKNFRWPPSWLAQKLVANIYRFEYWQQIWPTIKGTSCAALDSGRLSQHKLTKQSKRRVLVVLGLNLAISLVSKIKGQENKKYKQPETAIVRSGTIVWHMNN